jgi:hypothetical protein
VVGVSVIVDAAHGSFGKYYLSTVAPVLVEVKPVAEYPVSGKINAA